MAATTEPADIDAGLMTIRVAAPANARRGDPLLYLTLVDSFGDSMTAALSPRARDELVRQLTAATR